MSASRSDGSGSGIEAMQDRVCHWVKLRDSARGAYGRDDAVTLMYADKVRDCVAAADALGLSVRHLAGDLS